MEEVVIKKEEPKKNREMCTLMAGLSAFASIAVSGYCIYLAVLGNWWFIPLAVCFLFECFFLIWPLFKPEDYQAMYLQGLGQILGVLILMHILVLWGRNSL